MKPIHLLSIPREPDPTFEERLRQLVDAISDDGGRVGRLCWTPEQAVLPADASTAVLRTVHLGSDGSVATKARTGPPVLRDILREHFRGCRLVLVEVDEPSDEAHGAVTATLAPGTAADDWLVDGRPVPAHVLVARLRSPKPLRPTSAES